MKKFIKIIMFSTMMLPIPTSINNSLTAIIVSPKIQHNNTVYIYNIYNQNLKPDEVQRSISIEIRTICTALGLKDFESISMLNQSQAILGNYKIVTSKKTIGQTFVFDIINHDKKIKLIIKDNRQAFYFPGLSAVGDFERISGNNNHSFYSEFEQKVINNLKHYIGIPYDTVLNQTDAVFGTHYFDGSLALYQSFYHNDNNRLNNDLWNAFQAFLPNNTLIDIYVDNTYYAFYGDVVHYWIKYSKNDGTRIVDNISDHKYSVFTTGVGAKWQVKILPFEYYALN